MSLRKIAFITIILSGLLILGCGQKQTEEELFKQAQEYETQENFTEAVKTYEMQLEDYPQGQYADEAIERVAFVYYNNIHDFEKAIEFHERLINEYPESEFVSRARFMIGFIYANNMENYELAKQHYNRFLELYPESELSESVKWELEHLGKDVNLQDDIFGNAKSNGEVTK